MHDRRSIPMQRPSFYEGQTALGFLVLGLSRENQDHLSDEMTTLRLDSCCQECQKLLWVFPHVPQISRIRVKTPVKEDSKLLTNRL